MAGRSDVERGPDTQRHRRTGPAGPELLQGAHIGNPRSLRAAHRVQTSTVQQGFTWSATQSLGANVLGVGQLVVGHNSVSDPLPIELTNLIQDCRLINSCVTW